MSSTPGAATAAPDGRAMSQHIMGQNRMLESVGGLWFGEEPQIPLL